jgi:hypothetical protein
LHSIKSDHIMYEAASKQPFGTELPWGIVIYRGAGALFSRVLRQSHQRFLVGVGTADFPWKAGADQTGP